MDDADERIPTIPSAYKPAKKGGKSVPKTLLKAVSGRIQSRVDLYTGLLKFWPTGTQAECMDKLVLIVAQGLFDIEERAAAIRERDRALQLSHKTKRKHFIDRSEKIENFKRIAFRRVMTQVEALSLTNTKADLKPWQETGTKTIPPLPLDELVFSKPARHDRDPFRRTVIYLYDYFSGLTSQPYKYMAAITALFGMHPREFCVRQVPDPENPGKKKDEPCPHIPLPRKRTKKVRKKSLPTRITDGVGLCKLDLIFKCPRHMSGRQLLKKILDNKIEQDSPPLSPS